MFASPALCRNPGGTTDPLQASCQREHCRRCVTPSVRRPRLCVIRGSRPNSTGCARKPKKMGIRSPAPHAVLTAVPLPEVVRSKVGFLYICPGRARERDSRRSQISPTNHSKGAPPNPILSSFTLFERPQLSLARNLQRRVRKGSTAEAAASSNMHEGMECYRRTV
jgi:hypothetical protein